MQATGLVPGCRATLCRRRPQEYIRVAMFLFRFTLNVNVEVMASSWHLVGEVFKRNLRGVKVGRPIFNDDLSNFWSNVIVYAYVINDLDTYFDSPLAIAARNAPLNSLAFQRAFVMLKITREMNELGTALSNLQRALVDFNMKKMKLKEGEKLVTSFNGRQRVESKKYEERGEKMLEDLIEILRTPDRKTEALKAFYGNNVPTEEILLTYLKNESMWCHVTMKQEQYLPEDGLQQLQSKRKTQLAQFARKVVQISNKFLEMYVVGADNNIQVADSTDIRGFQFDKNGRLSTARRVRETTAFIGPAAGIFTNLLRFLTLAPTRTFLRVANSTPASSVSTTTTSSTSASTPARPGCPPPHPSSSPTTPVAIDAIEHAIEFLTRLIYNYQVKSK